MTPVGRLAPSPTGAQHVGNARTYLLAWLWTRSRDGRMILRMEDIDSPRTKPGADAQAIEDLRWLGLDWEEGPDVGGPNAPYVQTQRIEYYRSLLEELKRRELVYPCTCTRKDVVEAASAPHEVGTEPMYPGMCAHRSVADATRLAGPFCWRFRTPVREITFDDAFVGVTSAIREKFGGDFVVWKNENAPAYQLAVVADDHAMGITEVLRGDDLINSTYRQIHLYETFGWTPPRFAHVPLVVGPDGKRLAKRHGDSRIETIRAAGVSSQAFIGFLAHSAGLRPTSDPIAPMDLVETFSLDCIPQSPFVFRMEMLC